MGSALISTLMVKSRGKVIKLKNGKNIYIFDT